ncbi:MAG: CPBP family intramembrane metalloprotease [Flavobacteriaceae bacterium]|jgi:membrane protease YdiL (CAAX protease family)|nr:CPBP family intramembrane metalloprotease [Flavobacteriaceae bacterium]
MIWKIILFVFITFFFTAILAISQQKTNLSFERITLPQLAPAITVLILFLIYGNLPASINFSLDKSILCKSLIAFVFPLILFAITFFIGKQIGLNVKITEKLSKLIPVMLVGMLLGALGEEIGWRSFLQPVLEKKSSILFASIIIGLIWGLWHVGHYKNGFLFMTGFLLFTTSASIIIAWLLRNTEYNLIVAAIFHLSINIGFVFFFYNSLEDGKFMLINGIVWLIPAIGIIIMNGKVFYEIAK